jgi:arylsulfatase A-like enzyme
MRLGWFKLATSVLLLALSLAGAEGKGRAERVVLVVLDGMRPDFVTEHYAPTLAALRRDGVFFANNHPVYPSSTNVNGAALATGCYPGHTGILGNEEYRAAVDLHRPFDTSEYPGFDSGDPHLIAKYLATSTLPDLLHQAGEKTAIAGSKPVVQLFDRWRNRKLEPAKKSLVVYRGKILPKEASASIIDAIGPFPPRHSFPNQDQDAWTTRALTDVLWKDGLPKFSLLWLSEPDLSEHQTAPGSPTSLAAVRNADANVGKVIAALKAKNALTTTDIMVVSDHGFSTIDLAVDVAARLRAAGFDAVRAFADQPPRGQILVVTLGGSVEFYVAGHDPEITQRLIDFLPQSDFAGVIFTREAHDGTFTYTQAEIETPDAPDVLMACRWEDKPNQFGIGGAIASDIGHAVGEGTHTTLSPSDMHNTLLACGPDFRRGWTDETPSGNVDVAPTILAILGEQGADKMDGRVLEEAFPDGKPAPEEKSKRIEARRGDWRQILSLTTVGHTTYFLQGNRAPQAKTP